MLINKYFQFVCKVVFAVGQGFEVTINTTSSVCNKLATSISSIRVPTWTGKPGKPGKMGRHFPVREF